MRALDCARSGFLVTKSRRHTDLSSQAHTWAHRPKWPLYRLFPCSLSFIVPERPSPLSTMPPAGQLVQPEAACPLLADEQLPDPDVDVQHGPAASLVRPTALYGGFIAPAPESVAAPQPESGCSESGDDPTWQQQQQQPPASAGVPGASACMSLQSLAPAAIPAAAEGRGAAREESLCGGRLPLPASAPGTSLHQGSSTVPEHQVPEQGCVLWPQRAACCSSGGGGAAKRKAREVEAAAPELQGGSGRQGCDAGGWVGGDAGRCVRRRTGSQGSSGGRDCGAARSAVGAASGACGSSADVEQGSASEPRCGGALQGDVGAVAAGQGVAVLSKGAYAGCGGSGSELAAAAGGVSCLEGAAAAAAGGRLLVGAMAEGQESGGGSGEPGRRDSDGSSEGMCDGDPGQRRQQQQQPGEGLRPASAGVLVV